MGKFFVFIFYIKDLNILNFIVEQLIKRFKEILNKLISFILKLFKGHFKSFFNIKEFQGILRFRY